MRTETPAEVSELVVQVLCQAAEVVPELGLWWAGRSRTASSDAVLDVTAPAGAAERLAPLFRSAPPSIGGDQVTLDLRAGPSMSPDTAWVHCQIASTDLPSSFSLTLPSWWAEGPWAKVRAGADRLVRVVTDAFDPQYSLVTSTSWRLAQSPDGDYGGSEALEWVTYLADRDPAAFAVDFDTEPLARGALIWVRGDPGDCEPGWVEAINERYLSRGLLLGRYEGPLAAPP
jgi:hypothetical protein